MPRRLLCAALLGLVVAGCGEEEEAQRPGPQSPQQEGAAPKGEQGGQSPNSVSMQYIEFNPKSINVKTGDTVTWTNDESVSHDVTGEGFRSGPPGGMQQGDTYRHKFREAGRFDYRCTVHPNMTGTVVVSR